MPTTALWLVALAAASAYAERPNPHHRTHDAVVKLQLPQSSGRGRRNEAFFSPRGANVDTTFGNLGQVLEAPSRDGVAFRFDAGSVQYRIKKLSR